MKAKQMVDFKALLSKPADSVKRPPALPPGTYNGQIVGTKFGESRDKKTPFLQLDIKLMSPGDDVDQEAMQGIDLGKRTMRRDYYLTEDALWRLTDLITSCGISLEGKSIGECVPELVNVPVLVGVTQRPGKDPETIYNDISTLQGVG